MPPKYVADVAVLYTEFSRAQRTDFEGAICKVVCVSKAPFKFSLQKENLKGALSRRAGFKGLEKRIPGHNSRM